MLRYEKLTKETEEKVASAMPSAFACKDSDALRFRDIERDIPTVFRGPFFKDGDKIINCPYFNRYADKTQVFSFYQNDDVTRRSLHVQIVSRIARIIGKALGLNTELIEAIALGHDIGHPAFAHSGEVFLSDVYEKHTGRFFNHSIQSVRALSVVFPYNLTLQTLDGIAFHNGEMESNVYEPTGNRSWDVFQTEIAKTYTEKDGMKKCCMPSTLEGCVVRIADIISYLGKDRQDAERMKRIQECSFSDNGIGTVNAEILNNLIVNIIETSYGKPYIAMDEKHFEALKVAKAENYQLIYFDEKTKQMMDSVVKPMYEELYERLLSDLLSGNRKSPIFTHHISYVGKAHYDRPVPYEDENPNDIVVDYIASMTDDYFVNLYQFLFPESTKTVEYKGYFD